MPSMSGLGVAVVLATTLAIGTVRGAAVGSVTSKPEAAVVTAAGLRAFINLEKPDPNVPEGCASRTRDSRPAAMREPLAALPCTTAPCETDCQQRCWKSNYLPTARAVRQIGSVCARSGDAVADAVIYIYTYIHVGYTWA